MGYSGAAVAYSLHYFGAIGSYLDAKMLRQDHHT